MELTDDFLPEIERRWSIFILDHEESHVSPRRSSSPSPEYVYSVGFWVVFYGFYVKNGMVLPKKA